MDEDVVNRSFQVLFLVFILISGGLYLSPELGPGVSSALVDQPLADIDKVGNWSVTGTETYSDSVIDLAGNLSISGTLILDNSYLLMNSTGPSNININVLSGGSFTLRNGSLIYGVNGGKYTFTSDAGSSVLINGSRVVDCGVPSFNVMDTGIYTRSTNFQVLHSSIEDGEVGIIGDGATIKIWGSNISNMVDTGIRLINNSVGNATLLNISQCSRSGIDIIGSTLDLRTCIFQEVEYSVKATNSTIDISGSALSGIGLYSMMINSSTVTLVDSRPLNIGVDHIMVAYPAGIASRVLLLNCTFPIVDNFDPMGDVKEAFRFDVKVLTNDGEPAEDADVEIKNIFGTVIFQGLCNEFGYIDDIPLPVYMFNLTGKHPLTPHNVSVFFEGATRYMDVDASLSHFVEVTVILSNPEIIYEYPIEGEWINTNNFYLIGRVDGLRPITDLWMSIDGSSEIRVPGGSPFSFPLDLFDGEHVISMVTKNDDGRYGVKNLTFGIDSISPMITITSPESTSYSNGSNVWVMGTCSLDADLYVGEFMVPINASTSEFKTSVSLVEGRNDILLRAVDKAGNTDEKRVTVYKDGTPPRILIFSPTNGTRINNHEILLTGSTDSGTQHLWINGLEVELEMGGFEFLVDDLKEGTNRINVVAQDMTGTRTVRHVTVIVDTEPPELIITDAPALTNQYEVTITGVTDPEATVIVNNQILVVNGGVFSVDVELFEGDNEVAILARDDLGNTNVVYRTIILDVESPTFESILPSSGTVVTNPILEIICTLYDESGIRNVRGRVGSDQFIEISTNGEFNWIVNLVAGENIVDIEAMDKAGNIELKQLSYTYRPKVSGLDTTPPTVVITSPRINESVVEGTITIEGWAMDDTELATIHVRVGDGEWTEVHGSNAWSLEIELAAGVHKIEARAVDSSGNEKIDRLWVSIVIDSNEGESNGRDKSSTSLIIIIVVFMILLVGFVFGYLLYIRNRNLRGQLDEVRVRNEERERTKQRSPRTRRPDRARHSPERRRP